MPSPSATTNTDVDDENDGRKMLRLSGSSAVACGAIGNGCEGAGREASMTRPEAWSPRGVATAGAKRWALAKGMPWKMSSALGYLAEAGWKAPTMVQPLTVTVGEEDMAGGAVWAPCLAGEYRTARWS